MAVTLYSPHRDELLKSLQFQGQSNDCGPYTTSTVLNALLDLHIDAANFAREMDKPVWRGPIFIVRRVPHWATFPWGIVDTLKEYGLHATWRPFASISYLKREITRSKVLMPIIGSIIPLWAHVMTLIGWDDQHGWGFANTQLNHHNPYWLSDEDFAKQWRAMMNILIEVHNA